MKFSTLTRKRNKIEARDGEICSAEYKEEEGYALRAIKESRPVFGYTYDRKDPAGKLIANAQALLPVMEIDEDMVFTGSYSELSDRTACMMHPGLPCTMRKNGPSFWKWKRRSGNMTAASRPSGIVNFRRWKSRLRIANSNGLECDRAEQPLCLFRHGSSGRGQ